MIYLVYLRKARLAKGYSQQDMADYLGISRQAYNNYENDARSPDFETLLKIGEYLGVSLDYLIRGVTGDGVDTDDVLEYREMLHKDKRYGVLLSASKKLTTSDLDAVIHIVESMGDGND